MFQTREETTYYLTEYQQLLCAFQPRRIENFNDKEYKRVKKECEVYFERDAKDELSRDEEMFFNLLCTLISEADHRCK